MRRRFAYDESQDPPAPVLPLLVAAPGSDDPVLVSSLIDTGADCTIVPLEVARRLRLPLVDRLLVEGLGVRCVARPFTRRSSASRDCTA